ncbi:hypothetical protein SCUP515_09431 [Seiridium cupressi]
MVAKTRSDHPPGAVGILSSQRFPGAAHLSTADHHHPAALGGEGSGTSRQQPSPEGKSGMIELPTYDASIARGNKKIFQGLAGRWKEYSTEECISTFLLISISKRAEPVYYSRKCTMYTSKYPLRNLLSMANSPTAAIPF